MRQFRQSNNTRSSASTAKHRSSLPRHCCARQNLTLGSRRPHKDTREIYVAGEFQIGDNFRVEPLTDQHERESFSCGVEALDRYFRRQIRQDSRRRITSAYLLIRRQSGAIAGFYTLANAVINLDQLPPELARRLPKYPQIPATLLGRLAVDLHHRGLGLGEFLLVDALRRSLTGSQVSASFAVVVDAKDQAARNFYGKFGFLEIKGSARRLMLPIETIAGLFR